MMEIFTNFNSCATILDGELDHQPLPQTWQITDVKELSSYVRRIFNGEI